MFTKFNSNTVNKKRAAALLLACRDVGGCQTSSDSDPLQAYLQAALEVQVYANDRSKRRRRDGGDESSGQIYSGSVAIKGGSGSIKTFRPGTVHIIDIHRIKLNTDDLHGDGVHSNVLVCWRDGSVERYDPFFSSGSGRSTEMQRFLDAQLCEWLEHVSTDLVYHRSMPDTMVHGPQFVEYMNGVERSPGEHFCYLWCVLFAAEVLRGVGSMAEAHRRLLGALNLCDVTEAAVRADESEAFLGAIRALVRDQGLG